MDNYVRHWVIQIEILFEQTRSFCKSHPCVRDQSNQPSQVIIKGPAFGLQRADRFDWHRFTIFDTSTSVVVHTSKWVGQSDSGFRSSEIDD